MTELVLLPTLLLGLANTSKHSFEHSPLRVSLQYPAVSVTSSHRSLPKPSSYSLDNPEIEPMSPALEVDSLPLEEGGGQSWLAAHFAETWV